jgi:hypothetical protein
MKEYWHIPGVGKASGDPCVAFCKYDGSNIRWEWSKKRRWYKFGARHRLFDETDPDLGPAIPLFLETVGPKVEEVIKKNFPDSQTVTVFTEFFGQSSFAGHHIREEPKELRLFDVCLYKKGLLSPTEFVKFFGFLPFSAQVVYTGNLDEQFVTDVRAGKYPVVEGVVCKGGSGHRLWMVKVKTDSYKKRLMELFGQDWKRLWE